MLALCVCLRVMGGALFRPLARRMFAIKGHMEKGENGGTKWREEPLMKKR